MFISRSADSQIAGSQIAGVFISWSAERLPAGKLGCFSA